LTDDSADIELVPSDEEYPVEVIAFYLNDAELDISIDLAGAQTMGSSTELDLVKAPSAFVANPNDPTDLGETGEEFRTLISENGIDVNYLITNDDKVTPATRVRIGDTKVVFIVDCPVYDAEDEFSAYCIFARGAKIENIIQYQGVTINTQTGSFTENYYELDTDEEGGEYLRYSTRIVSGGAITRESFDVSNSKFKFSAGSAFFGVLSTESSSNIAIKPMVASVNADKAEYMTED